MDFEFSEEQQAVIELAGQILTDKCTHERLKELEADPTAWAEDEHRALADAGLVGIALPEEDGGAGFGILEACLVLEQVGRSVAPVPYLATVVLGAMPVARFGSAAQRAALLPGVVSGDVVLTAALAESGRGIAATVPSTTAARDGAGWRLDGEKRFVPWAARAHRVLVPVTTAEGLAIFLVDPTSPGVTLEAIRTTSGEPQSVLRLESVSVGADDLLAGPGTEHDGDTVLRWLVDHGTAAVCATQAGVTARAVELTGTYTSERHQFGSPIATFQAVAHRAADAYVDAAAVRFCAWQAAWRLSEGLPAADALDVAKYWAAEGGQRVVHAAQHLHGGIGVDRDYPLHRYFLWAKVGELTLGGATDRLVALGARLAASPG
jgi:alkylation response protein AidB-like acyl-CoA dehydrogenase